ncbi:MAG: ribosome biogenesis GTP-binding protein YihA/YsxC [Spirosomataceae bacterium]
MKIKTAVFVKSSSLHEQCPEADRPEYAFIGRSNVGKSSLINALTGHGNLAKISSKPGKTQVINHFMINDAWYLVDLPGYGYAKVSQADRQKWAKMIDDYLFNRQNLICTFVLIDARIEPQKIDLEFMEKLGQNGLPFCLVFTKTDKLRPHQLQTQLNNYRQKLLETWVEVPQIFVTSSVAKVGQRELLTQIEEWNSSE